jgi:hypothetical protein
MCASEGLLKGTVIDSAAQTPVSNAGVFLKNDTEQLSNTTNYAGEFSFNLPEGVWDLRVTAGGYAPTEQQVVTEGKALDLGLIRMEKAVPAETQAAPAQPQTAPAESQAQPQAAAVPSSPRRSNRPAAATPPTTPTTPSAPQSATAPKPEAVNTASQAVATETPAATPTVTPAPAEAAATPPPQPAATPAASEFITIEEVPSPTLPPPPVDAQPLVGLPSAPDVQFFENSDDDDTQMMSVMLSSSQDAFANASYHFNAMRFKARGYDYTYAQTFLNGLPMNDINNGNSPWSLWGGLNDATRNQESTVGIDPTTYSSGALGGTTNILARASQVRQGFRLSYALTNNSYNNRVMATYATDLGRGWYVALSASTRLSDGEGRMNWVTGTFYEGYSYFLSVEKRFNDRHSLAFTGFGAPLQRGAQMASTQEAYDLVRDNYYNPNWGWQNGVMRNARVRNTHEPVAMLDYVFKASQKLKFTVAASYRFGFNGYSALDWYDASDPRPDYYRYLPSYINRSNETRKAMTVEEGWLTDPNIRHVNWERLYNVNYSNYDVVNNATVDGVRGQSVAGNRSKYILEERHTDQRDLNFGATVNYVANDYLKINGGINHRRNRTEYYKTIKDLLGGDYWLDIDQFAERDFPDNALIVQNDLNHPNRIVGQGDKYGYDYYAHTQTEKLWVALNLNWQKLEGFLSADYGYTMFYREGLFKKGLFPDQSYGNSAVQFFTNYSAKAGLNYKLTGHHIFSATVLYQQQAPWFQEAFLSPRTRNSTVTNLVPEKVFSIDAGYSLRMPAAKIRFSGYYTTITDQTRVMSFYDDILKAFGNYAIRGIDQRHAGVELGADIALGQGFSAIGAISYGDYVYTSNPLVTETKDNSQEIVLQDERVYWNDFYVPGTPQLATSIDLDYSGPNSIYADINLNYYDYSYIDLNPIRRTDFVLTGINTNTPEGMQQFADLRRQEKFDGGFVLNASVGKNFFIQRKYMLGMNLQVNNILNNQNLKSGGYEQLRVNKPNTSTGATTYSAFDSKYYYMFGTTFFLNVYFRF